MVSAVNTMLAAVDQSMKSLDIHRYSRWLLLPSAIVVALMLPWVLGDLFGVGFRAPLRLLSWPASAPFVAFSFIGLSTTWRTQHRFGTKVGFFLWHALAVALFITPVLFSAGSAIRCVITSVAHQPSNQSMKPTAPPRNKSSVIATTPCRGLSLSR